MCPFISPKSLKKMVCLFTRKLTYTNYAANKKVTLSSHSEFKSVSVTNVWILQVILMKLSTDRIMTSLIPQIITNTTAITQLLHDNRSLIHIWSILQNNKQAHFCHSPGFILHYPCFHQKSHLTLNTQCHRLKRCPATINIFRLWTLW